MKGYSCPTAMLDIRKIRENPEFYRERLACRNGGDDKSLDQVLALDEQRRKCLQENEALKSDRNRASKEIGALKAKGLDITEASAQVKKLGDRISQNDATQAEIETALSDLLLRIPNVNHESVPVGKTAEDNRVERVIGKPASFDFKPKPHWEIGARAWADRP